MKFSRSIASVISTLLLAVASFAATTTGTAKVTATFPTQPQVTNRPNFTQYIAVVGAETFGLADKVYDHTITDDELISTAKAAISDLVVLKADKRTVGSYHAVQVIVTNEARDRMSGMIFVAVDNHIIVVGYTTTDMDPNSSVDNAGTFFSSVKINPSTESSN